MVKKKSVELDLIKKRFWNICYYCVLHRLEK